MGTATLPEAFICRVWLRFLSLAAAISTEKSSGNLTLSLFPTFASGFTQVMMPGDPEIEEAKQRSAQGIPLDGVLWQDFNKMATELNVEPLKLL